VDLHADVPMHPVQVLYSTEVGGKNLKEQIRPFRGKSVLKRQKRRLCWAKTLNLKSLHWGGGRRGFE